METALLYHRINQLGYSNPLFGLKIILYKIVAIIVIYNLQTRFTDTPKVLEK